LASPPWRAAQAREVLDLGIAADRLDALDEALDTALAHEVDVLVTIGGASVGDHDLVQKALTARGMALDFWKIAMRPGKPLMSGDLGKLRVLGLPGNPASSLVCAHLFLEPLIARLAGRADPERKKTAQFWARICLKTISARITCAAISRPMPRAG
jgi:molybdopterin molybdotransferase